MPVAKFVTDAEPAIIGYGRLVLVVGSKSGLLIDSSYQVTRPSIESFSIVSVY